MRLGKLGPSGRGVPNSGVIRVGGLPSIFIYWGPQLTSQLPTKPNRDQKPMSDIPEVVKETVGDEIRSKSKWFGGLLWLASGFLFGIWAHALWVDRHPGMKCPPCTIAAAISEEGHHEPPVCLRCTKDGPCMLVRPIPSVTAPSGGELFPDEQAL